MLNNAKDDGWRVLGAAADVPGSARSDEDGAIGDLDKDDDVIINQQHHQYLDLQDVETKTPTILVLGSEGRGLRTLVSRACSSFVQIPGGVVVTGDGDGSSQAGVDSLNVSVTGGILIWHFLSGIKNTSE
jgi:21S rRNA (GM2251-2'-O)-methyltransferase